MKPEEEKQKVEMLRKAHDIADPKQLVVSITKSLQEKLGPEFSKIESLANETISLLTDEKTGWYFRIRTEDVKDHDELRQLYNNFLELERSVNEWIKLSDVLLQKYSHNETDNKQALFSWKNISKQLSNLYGSILSEVKSINDDLSKSRLDEDFIKLYATLLSKVFYYLKLLNDKWLSWQDEIIKKSIIIPQPEYIDIKSGVYQVTDPKDFTNNISVLWKQFYNAVEKIGFVNDEIRSKIPIVHKTISTIVYEITEKNDTKWDWRLKEHNIKLLGGENTASENNSENNVPNDKFSIKIIEPKDNEVYPTNKSILVKIIVNGVYNTSNIKFEFILNNNKIGPSKIKLVNSGQVPSGQFYFHYLLKDKSLEKEDSHQLVVKVSNNNSSVSEQVNFRTSDDKDSKSPIISVTAQVIHSRSKRIDNKNVLWYDKLIGSTNFPFVINAHNLKRKKISVDYTVFIMKLDSNNKYSFLENTENLDITIKLNDFKVSKPKITTAGSSSVFGISSSSNSKVTELTEGKNTLVITLGKETSKDSLFNLLKINDDESLIVGLRVRLANKSLLWFNKELVVDDAYFIVKRPD